MRLRSAFPRLCRFLKDDTGSATMEFVIWLPWLCLWLIFSSAAFIAWDARSSAAKAAYTIADIFSRFDPVQSAALEQLVDLHDRLVVSATGINKVRFSSIERLPPVDPSDPTEEPAYTVLWSCAYGFDNAMSDAYVPTELIPVMASNENLLIAEFVVPFVPISAWGGLKPFDWSHVQLLRPRIGTTLNLPSSEGCGASASSSYFQP